MILISKLLVKIFYIEAKAFRQLSSIYKYLFEKNLLLNPKKTKFLTFSARDTSKSVRNTRVCIYEHVLEVVDRIKYLGLLADNKLSWNSQTELV